MNNKLLALLVGFLANHLIALVFFLFLLFAVFNRGSLFGCNGQAGAEVAESKPGREERFEQPEPASGQQKQQASPKSTAAALDSMVFRPLPKPESAGIATEASIAPPPPAKKLDVARNAFWQSDFALAERHYLDYLAQQPNDANILGELANVYQAQGKTAQALDTYFAAGMRFKDLGEQAKLDELVAFFRAANDPRATKLQE